MQPQVYQKFEAFTAQFGKGGCKFVEVRLEYLTCVEFAIRGNSRQFWSILPKVKPLGKSKHEKRCMWQPLVSKEVSTHGRGPLAGRWNFRFCFNDQLWRIIRIVHNKICGSNHIPILLLTALLLLYNISTHERAATKPFIA